MEEQELEQEQSQDGQSNPEIKKRLISADEARQLMVRSVRGLDSKLNEVSKIIQTTARRGETRAEVHSVQSSRSSLPIFDRIDNLGRVLLGSLRDSGYDAKLREFRTADSCMLYIIADWSRAIEKKPEDNDSLPKASEAAGGKRKPADPERKPRSQPSSARARAAAPSLARGTKKADEPAEPESEHGTAQKSSTDIQTKDVMQSDASAQQAAASSSAEVPGPSIASNQSELDAPEQDQINAAGSDSGKKGTKTKKFDRSKLLSSDAAIEKARHGQKLLTKAGKKSEDYAYSTEINGERIPIILPVVMPSPRLPL